MSIIRYTCVILKSIGTCYCRPEHTSNDNTICQFTKHSPPHAHTAVHSSASSCIYSSSHSLSYTYITLAHNKVLKHWVKYSNWVHKHHLMSSSSPSLLEKVIQDFLSMTDPTHILLGRPSSSHAVLELL